MKILIILHGGRAGPYVMLDLADTFQELGHETVTMRTDDLMKVAEEMPTVEGLKELSRNIHSLAPDFVIGYGATSVFYFHIKGGPSVNLFESLQIPYVAIYYDNPMLEVVFPSVAATLGSKIHHMFIWDRYYLEELEKLGFTNLHFMPIAANTKRYRKLPDQAREASPYKCDVSFVGTWSAKRDLVLRRLADCDMQIYGYDWDKASAPLREKFLRKADNISDLPFIYNYAGVNVNVTMEQGITSLNMRVFDVMACEGFLVSDYKSDFEELFDMDKEIVCYRHVDELRELTDFYLKNDAARREIARAGRRRVLREHSYKQRAKFILDTLKEQGIG